MEDADEAPESGKNAASARDLRSEAAFGAGAVLSLAAIWALFTGACFALGEGGAIRFFDLPLGVYVAGQGVLMAAVLASVRLSRAV